jgi:hypothetical protein
VEVARHHRTADLWIIIGDRVLDVSGYAARHPGGRALLQAHAGQDVTQVFRSLTVHQAPAIARIASSLAVGRVLPADPRHERLLGVLYLILSCQQALVMQYEHPMHTPALKLFSDENAHMMLWRENLPAAYELLEPGAWREISEDDAVQRLLAEAQQLSRQHDWRGELSHDLRTLIELRCEALRRDDLALLESLFELAAQAAHAAAEEPDPGAALAERCAQLSSAMRREILARARVRQAVLARGKPASRAPLVASSDMLPAQHR